LAIPCATESPTCRQPSPASSSAATARSIDAGLGFPAWRNRIRLGQQIDPAQLADLCNALPEDRSAVDQAIARTGMGLLISPAAPGPAPAGIGGTESSVMNQPWTYTGNPVVTLPGGRLPMGLQVIGRHGQDERLPGWAKAMAGLVA